MLNSELASESRRFRMHLEAQLAEAQLVEAQLAERQRARTVIEPEGTAYSGTHQGIMNHVLDDARPADPIAIGINSDKTLEVVHAYGLGRVKIMPSDVIWDRPAINAHVSKGVGGDIVVVMKLDNDKGFVRKLIHLSSTTKARLKVEETKHALDDKKRILNVKHLNLHIHKDGAQANSPAVPPEYEAGVDGWKARGFYDGMLMKELLESKFKPLRKTILDWPKFARGQHRAEAVKRQETYAWLKHWSDLRNEFKVASHRVEEATKAHKLAQGDYEAPMNKKRKRVRDTPIHNWDTASVASSVKSCIREQELRDEEEERRALQILARRRV